jgi:hypothetical protein
MQVLKCSRCGFLVIWKEEGIINGGRGINIDTDKDIGKFRNIGAMRWDGKQLEDLDQYILYHKSCPATVKGVFQDVEIGADEIKHWKYQKKLKKRWVKARKIEL